MARNGADEPAMPTAVLVIVVRQLLGGRGSTCLYCSAPAVATVSTGADPDRDPVCGEHAAGFLEIAADTVRKLGRVG